MRSISIVVLIEAPPDRVWAELADLGSHPEWMGGPSGACLARPVFGRIWRENLKRLRRRLEVSGP